MDQAEILRDYLALRGVLIPLNSRLAKSLSTDEIGAAAAALGMLHGKHIDLETEDEISVMVDYAIYNLFRDGRNAVDRMLQENPPPQGSLELRLLRSMQRSHHTIFEVQETIPGLGVRGFDGVEKTPTLIVDQGFSTTATPRMGLAARIHSPAEGWWMTTGAALPLNQKAATRIIIDLKNHERRAGIEPSQQERTTIITRACVEAGASRQIAYADPGAGVPRGGGTIFRDSPKVGRNDPCSCGSGKKYKKCCGN